MNAIMTLKLTLMPPDCIETYKPDTTVPQYKGEHTYENVSIKRGVY